MSSWFVSRASFPRSAEDEFYWVDLIGLDVVNREGEALGKVVGLLDTGPHSVLRCVAEAEGPLRTASRRSRRAPDPVRRPPTLSSVSLATSASRSTGASTSEPVC
jgi:hypothetical protein